MHLNIVQVKLTHIYPVKSVVEATKYLLSHGVDYV